MFAKNIYLKKQHRKVTLRIFDASNVKPGTVALRKRQEVMMLPLVK